MINRFVIFGDSYSTHKDYIPEGYPHYYCDEGRAPDQPVTKMTMEQTWWGQMIGLTKAELVLNDSWSGSTIGYTGYAGDCSTSSSFIYRYRKLSEKNFIVSAIRRINTFILVCVAWLAFRANNVGEMFTLIKRLFTFTKGGFAITMDTMGLNLISVLTIVSSIAVMLMLDNLIAYSGKDGSAAVVKSGAAFYFVWVIAVIWLLIASRDAASSFIYFAF